MDERPYEVVDGEPTPLGGFRVSFKRYERLPLTPSNLALLRLQR
jgi:hypothetical protein